MQPQRLLEPVRLRRHVVDDDDLGRLVVPRTLPAPVVLEHATRVHGRLHRGTHTAKRHEFGVDSNAVVHRIVGTRREKRRERNARLDVRVHVRNARRACA